MNCALLALGYLATVSPQASPLKTASSTGSAPVRQNVLVVILDDVGLDAIGCYPGANEDARTPCIDRLSRNGLRFETVWSYPACSPTRATILTGKYGFRTGIGSIVKLDNGDPGLALKEVCLPEWLRAKSSDLRTAFLGKWHLAGVDHGPDHARQQGFEHFRGTRSNLGRKGRKDPYFHYDEIVDGEEKLRNAYATTAVTDDALAAIETFADSPWLVVTSYHAAHGPLHVPPKALRTIELSGHPKRSRHEHFAAMVEALDHEVGRLWTSLPEATRARTTIIIIGDNGGASGQMPAEIRRGQAGEKVLAGKGSLGESGIRVPLIVAGAGVAGPGRTVPHLVNTTDVYDTAADLLLRDVPGGTPDSISFRPYLASATAPAVREWIFSERFHGANKNTKSPATSRVAIRDARYKLIEDSLEGGRRLYDLDADPREGNNLLRAKGLDEGATAALGRFTSILAGPLGKDRKVALAKLK